MLTEARAVEIAEAAHAGQVDKAGRPYIDHPKRVMEKFSDPELRIIAVLHDAIEDSALTIHDLHAIGASLRVRSALDAITHPRGEPNEVYWDRVKQNPDALAVKIEDIRDNLDGERLDLLPAEVEQRCVRKYARALLALGGTSDAVIDLAVMINRRIGEAHVDEPIKPGDKVAIEDRDGVEYTVDALSGVTKSSDHLGAPYVIWVNRMIQGSGYEPFPWPVEYVRPVSGGSQTGEPG